jgi:hypothetical protein
MWLAMNARDTRVCSIRVDWNLIDMTLFGIAISRRGRTMCRLVVERLPDGEETWDWIVWRAGATRHGIAPSVLLAMDAAQKAAWTWPAADGVTASPTIGFGPRS